MTTATPKAGTTDQIRQVSASRRYRIPDILRGITLLSMTGYHLMWDLVYLYGVRAPWYRSYIGYIWQQSICWSFILLSGFCWGLGKRPLRRGIYVSLCGALVTIATVIFMPEQRVVFGVLTFLGAAMLLMIPTEKLTRNLPPAIGLSASALLFFLIRNVNLGTLGFEGLELAQLPDSLYQNLLTTFLGFPGPDFASTDYFSLLPWFFLFSAGHFLRRLLQPVMERSRQPKTDGLLYSLSKPLVWLGQHSLLLYMLHQPIIYGICMAVFALI